VGIGSEEGSFSRNWKTGEKKDVSAEKRESEERKEVSAGFGIRKR
jgi:hypothetical protein